MPTSVRLEWKTKIKINVKLNKFALPGATTQIQANFQKQNLESYDKLAKIGSL